MKYAFHPEALEEFENAASHYVSHDSDSAVRFVSSIKETITRISRFPRMGRVVGGEARRVLVKSFPYAIVYLIESDSLLLVAVMHCSREPGYWRSRID